jgi:hypothetical protein
MRLGGLLSCETSGLSHSLDNQFIVGGMIQTEKPWQCRKIARICAVFKVHMGEHAWKAIGEGLQRPC